MNILATYRIPESRFLIALIPCDGRVSPYVPAGSPILKKLAECATSSLDGAALPQQRRVTTAEILSAENNDITLQDIKSSLDNLGYRPLKESKASGCQLVYDCRLSVIKSAIAVTRALKKKQASSVTGKTSSRGHKRRALRGGPADALDWDEAQRLIRELISKERYRDALLLSCGCYLGLRISDILNLKWSDITETDRIVIIEKKTGKRRTLKVNPAMKELSSRLYTAMDIEAPSSLVFVSWARENGGPISRQRAGQILKEIAEEFNVTSAKRFSTHSLRKTFGRRVWQQECKRGRGEQALYLLGDVFGHSSVAITKRYLGIRQEEILSVYDNL